MSAVQEFVILTSPPRRGSCESTSSSEADFGIPVITQKIIVHVDSVESVASVDASQSDSKGLSLLDASDSGVECEDLVLPDQETCNKILAQVEHYFSDASISKDAFLLKHVKRNKEGFVSLKLVSSFKRLKQITKDWRVVAHAIKSSSKVQMNDAGTKIRRVDPLPEFDETTPTRTVVAANLPMERPTMENVAELFGKIGEIALIRIIRPGNVVPQDVKQFVTKHPQLGKSVCALVEFETSQASQKAAKTMTSEDWRALQVLLLTPPKKECQRKEDPKKKKKGKNKKNSIERLVADDSPSSSDTDDRTHRNRRSPHCSPALSRPNDAPWRRGSGLSSSESSTSPPKSPWMQRRLEAAVTDGRRGSLTLVNVVRQPRGPDNTKGFHTGLRGAPKPSVAVC